MASPFSIFRKYQKIMIAVVGLMAMFAFVLFAPLIKFFQGAPAGAANGVVLTWKNGELTEDNLYQKVIRYNQLNKFLNQIVVEAQAAGATPNLRPNLQGVNEQLVISYMLLSAKASEMGILLTNESLAEYLRQITGDAVPGRRMLEILSRGGGQGRFTQDVMFDTLRTKLLAEQVMLLFQPTLASTPPGERWEYFSKIKRKAQVEVAMLDVSSFLDQVPQPSDEEIQELFDKYKNQDPVPEVVDGVQLERPTPGFHQPFRRSFAYMMAEFDKLVNAEKPNITEQAIREYYEANKETRYRALPSTADLFPGTDFPETEPSVAPGSGDSKTAPGQPGSEEAAPEVATKEEPSEGETKGPETKVGVESEPEAETEVNSGAPEVESQPQEPQGETSVEPEQPQAGLKQFGVQQSIVSNWAVAGLTVAALLEDEEPEPQSPEDAPSEDVTVEDVTDEDSTLENGQPIPSETDSSIETSKDGEISETSEESTTGDTGSAQFIPLQEVQDEIRELLAQQSAMKTVGERLQQVRLELDSYSTERVLWRAKRAANPKMPEPPAPDFIELARKYGLSFHRTPLMSSLEMVSWQDSELGRSVRLVRDSSSQFGFREVPFVLLAFSPELTPYKVATTMDRDRNQYVFWSVDQKEPYVPKLSEVREEVVRAWKMAKARELAQKRANQYAATARETDKPLSEALAGITGVEYATPAPFSWLTQGLNSPDFSRRSLPRLSTMEELDNAGPAFMETVFGLKPGEVGVTANHPATKVYIVRLNEFTPSQGVLHIDFLATNYQRYEGAGYRTRVQIREAWNQEIEAEMRLEIYRPLDQPRKSSR